MASLVSAEFLLFAVTAALVTFQKKATATKSSSSSPKTCSDGSLSNSAFVFIKPHANTPATQSLVREKLIAAGIEILSEKDIDGATIDKKKLIDQHYYAIGTCEDFPKYDHLALNM